MKGLLSCVLMICAVSCSATSTSTSVSPLNIAGLNTDGLIVFSRATTLRDGRVDYDLYTVRADGTGERQLTSGPGSDWYPHWSPDGRTVAFERVIGARDAIWSIDRDGTHLTRLSPLGGKYGEPAYAPDGQQLAVGYIAPDSTTRSDIAIVAPSDPTPATLTTAADGEISPVWTPDGSTIIYSRHQHEGFRLFRADVSTGAYARISEGPGADWNPDVDATGTHIAFTSDRANRDLDACNADPPTSSCDMDVFISGIDGQEVQQVTSGSSRDYTPRWSPDGSSLVFARCDLTGPCPMIMIIAADGSDIRPVTEGFMPDWTS